VAGSSSCNGGEKNTKKKGGVGEEGWAEKGTREQGDQVTGEREIQWGLVI